MNETSIYNELALKSFVISTSGISESSALYVLDSIVNKAAEDSVLFRKTVTYLEKPLGDPNSSYRNENLYSNLLQTKIKSPWYDSASKAQVRNKLYLVMQNRVGSAANDFTYITPAGYKKRLYDLQTDFTILYFYNPECKACKEMKAALIASPVIGNKILGNQLLVLAIYTDKDEKIWLDHILEMPETWIQGRDENEYLYKNNIYDLRAIPTVYLLDRDKKVVVKDCVDVREIEKKIMGYQM